MIITACARPREKEREEIIRREMRKTGKKFRIEQPFYCDFWGRVTLGENFFSNYNFVLLAGNEVTFGDDVRIGPNCGIYAAGHAFDPERRAAGYEYARPVHIGNNVWIGGHVAIVVRGDDRGQYDHCGRERGDRGYPCKCTCRRQPVPGDPRDQSGG